MKRMKKIILVLVAVILLVPSFVVKATSTTDKSETDRHDGDGKVSAKDEVVYATLSANGDRKKIYVVNTFDIVKAGKIVDYGTYSSVKNLTDLSGIEQKKE